MDDLHGCGRKASAEKLRGELSDTLQFKEWVVHGTGDEYEHLKRERRLHDDRAEITPNRKYLDHVVLALNLENAKCVPTPSVAANMHQDESEDASLEFQEARLFRGAVGSLADYVIDRCDAQFGINNLTKSMKDPKENTMKRLKRTVRYLKGTDSARVVLHRPAPDHEDGVAFIRVWSDSDWASASDRKSQPSTKIEVDGCPMFSSSRKQKARAHSSGEAEYYAAVGGDV
jgi:hypothetical protein